MFRACELVVINKVDLLEHLDFDLDTFLYHLEAVHPGVEHLVVSAKTGEGCDELPPGSRARRAVRRRPPRVGRVDRVVTAAAVAQLRLPELLAQRLEAGERFFAAAGRPARAPVPPHGRALRPRRPAGRLRRGARPTAPTPATSRSSSSTR